MTQITVDSAAISKAINWICAVVVIVFAIWFGGMYVYGLGHDAGVASVPVAPVVVAPTPAPVTVVAAPVVQVPAIDYINDVQSFGTNYGYVCLVDGSGNEYLIMNFLPGTSELAGASYSGTVVSTYNGIPMLENVALTAYPAYYYPQNEPSQTIIYYHWQGNYYRDDIQNHRITQVPVDDVKNHHFVEGAPR